MGAGTRRLLVVGVAGAAVVALAVGVLVLGEDEDPAAALASWCAVARGRDLPSWVPERLEDPTPQAVPAEAAGAFDEESLHAWSTAMVRSILSDPPEAIEQDVEVAMGTLLHAYETRTPPAEADRDAAVAAAGRVQHHIDANCW